MLRWGVTGAFTTWDRFMRPPILEHDRRERRQAATLAASAGQPGSTCCRLRDRSVMSRRTEVDSLGDINSALLPQRSRPLVHSASSRRRTTLSHVEIPSWPRTLALRCHQLAFQLARPHRHVPAIDDSPRVAHDPQGEEIAAMAPPPK